MARLALSFFLIVVFLGCGARPPAGSNLDAELVREISAIHAIDNHGHPVRASAPGEAADREFDALPVDNMEAQTDPLALRDNAPGFADAWRALFGSAELAVKKTARDRVMAEKGAGYPAWVLDQMGVEVMLANRVIMGTGIA